jgi:alpha-beta hydrolase superfamily lysophospholipase
MGLDGSSGYLPARDGIGIFYQLWEALETKAWIVAHHGLGLHSGWYESLAGYLLPRNISTVALDMRGHGLTRSPLAKLPTPSVARNDMIEVIAAARDKAGGKPVLGMGTSLGGAVLLSVLACRESGLAGGILFSPAIKQCFIGKRETVGIFLGLLTGTRARFPTALGRGLTLTTDPRRRHELEADRLALRDLPSPAWVRAQQIMWAGGRAVTRVDAPLLVVQARGDEVIDESENARRFERKEGVTWAWWDSSHVVELSPRVEDVAELVARWIEEKVSA